MSGPNLTQFELLVENRQFSLPLSRLTPSLGVTRFEFLEATEHFGSRVVHGASSEDFAIIACVAFLTQYNSATSTRTERHTDRQTDASAVAKAAHLHSKLC